MFITLTGKSPFYQLVFEIDGKRTSISTKTKNKTEAYKFLVEFQQSRIQSKQKPISITLNKFKEEYKEHIRLTKSKSYLRSVRLSFKQFQIFTGDIQLEKSIRESLKNLSLILFHALKLVLVFIIVHLKQLFLKQSLGIIFQKIPLKK